MQKMEMLAGGREKACDDQIRENTEGESTESLPGMWYLTFGF